jgi:hypothetical protein
MKIPEWSNFHYSTEHRCPNTDVLDVDECGEPNKDEYGRTKVDGHGNPKPKCEIVFRTVKYNEAIIPMRYQQSLYPEKPQPSQTAGR